MNWSEYAVLLNNVNEQTPNWWHDQITELDLSIERFDNAIIKKSCLDVRARTMALNIFDSESVEKKLSHHLRGKHHNTFKVEPYCFSNAGSVTYIKGKSIFCGWIFPHYGHFLMETLSRLWCLEELNFAEYTFIFNYSKKK